MSALFGPRRFATVPEDASSVSVTRYGGSPAVLVTPVTVNDGFISFEVDEPGLYCVHISNARGFGVAYVANVLESVSSGHPEHGTIYDYIDDKIAELGGGGEDANAVHKTGNETIDGVKTFTSAPVVPDAAFAQSKVSGLSASIAAAQNRSNHTGSQSSSTISDFQEAVQDAVAAMMSGASGVTVTYNDAANTLVLTGSGVSSDPESVRDTIGAALLGVGNISITVNDAADTITISTTATVNSTDAQLRDRSTHTGTQAISTITNLQSSLDAKAASTHSHAQSDITGLSTTLAGKSDTGHSHATSDVTGLDTALSTKAPLNAPTFTGTATFSNAPAVPDNSFGIAKINGLQTALNAKAPLDSPAFTGTPTGITKSHVGLGNVDNTSDLNKPVSTAVQELLDDKAYIGLSYPVIKADGPTTVPNRETWIASNIPGYTGEVIWNTVQYVDHPGPGGQQITGDLWESRIAPVTP